MGSVREHFLPQAGGVVSLVGAGGKTTLMFRLAGELAQNGERVLTTTTTKILWPTEGQSAHVVVSADVRDVIKKAEKCLATHSHVTAGRGNLVPEEKLTGFDPSEIEQIREAGLFRWILVEADGAAGRPLKAPADYEPVVPTCSSLVVGVVGLDGVGQPLDERHVFRHDLFSRISGLPVGSPVTEESIACVIEHPEGLFKGCPAEAGRLVLLNKAEDSRTREAGQRIVSLLSGSGKGRIEKVVIGAIGGEPPTVSCHVRPRLKIAGAGSGGNALGPGNSFSPPGRRSG
jgi:probable selenium-dependent hydroxylase accessory protein YqeC